jgi:hypothetical protein
MTKDLTKIATYLIVGVIVVSAFNKTAQTSTIIGDITSGFSNLLGAVSAPVTGKAPQTGTQSPTTSGSNANIPASGPTTF